MQQLRKKNRLDDRIQNLRAIGRGEGLTSQSFAADVEGLGQKFLFATLVQRQLGAAVAVLGALLQDDFRGSFHVENFLFILLTRRMKRGNIHRSSSHRRPASTHLFVFGNTFHDHEFLLGTERYLLQANVSIA